MLSTANMRGFVAVLLCLCAAIVHAETPESSTFAPTIPNKTPAPRPAPEGMAWITGGEFSMGASTNGHGTDEMPMASNDSGPVHRVRVDGFWMDKTAVTNEQFEKFVKATGYVTIAERTRQRKNSRLRLPKIWSRARSCLRRPITKFHSTIIINGGVT
jgi:formylglycine-generating enzyme required for sulfatase activity